MELRVLFGTFVLLLPNGTPVAFCRGGLSFATVLCLGQPPVVVVVVQRLNSGVSVCARMATPFFIFAGAHMLRGDPTQDFPGWRMLARLLASAAPGPILVAILFGGVRSGTFRAMSPLIVITTPIFLPVAVAFDPVHVGVIPIRNPGIGPCTPQIHGTPP